MGSSSALLYSLKLHVTTNHKGLGFRASDSALGVYFSKGRGLGASGFKDLGCEFVLHSCRRLKDVG